MSLVLSYVTTSLWLHALLSVKTAKALCGVAVVWLSTGKTRLDLLVMGTGNVFIPSLRRKQLT